MIEIDLMEYLKDKLDIEVYMELPDSKDMPEEFIVVEKLGSSNANQIESVSIAIQSHSTRMYETAVLNDKVKEAMKSFDQLPNVSRCHLDSDYPFNYTDIKKYRYQAVYDIVHY